MAPDTLVVNGQVCDVVETYNHRGDEFAKVESSENSLSGEPNGSRVEGGHVEGYVEVPDNPAQPCYAVYCEECGHLEEQPDGSIELVNAKDHEVNHEGSARVLADIHEVKTGHSPDIIQRAA